MKREKTKKVVFTFRNTTEAIKMDKKCQELRIPGRIVPVPRTISASCGLCWIAEEAKEELVIKAITNFGLDTEGKYYCDLF